MAVKMMWLYCSAAMATVVAAGASKPNVWVIVADDLGFGDLGYTGSSIKTPNIDGLAKGGVILGHYYVMHCCTPTRSALHTARYPIRFGLQTGVIENGKRYGLNLTEKILPQYMKELGYATHAIGKWHLGLFDWKYTPTYRGYDSFMGYYGGSEDYFTHKDSGIDFHLDVGANCGPGCSQSLLADNGNYSAPLYADRALQVLRAHDASQPLFIYQAMQSVHCPIEAPPEAVAPYAHLAPQRQRFAGMVAELDSAVGRVYEAWQEKGMADNLLIWFTTDNGGPVGSKNGRPVGIGCATGSQNWPLRGGKGAYFQGGVRGTSWVHGAMLAPALVGTTNFELMHVVDLLPTVVDIAGGSAATGAPHPLDGVSQKAALLEGGPSARTDVLINIERSHPTTAPSTSGGCDGVPQYAIIKGRYKLLLGGGGTPNTWYHDDYPAPNGGLPVPEGGCLVACTPANASTCPVVPDVQIFDVIADESERHNLAPGNTSLLNELMEVVTRYNNTPYVVALMISVPAQGPCPCCPFNDVNGSLTPCSAE